MIEKMSYIYFSLSFNQSVSLLNDYITTFDINSFQCPGESLCSEEDVFGMLSLDTKKANGGMVGILARMLKSTASSVTLNITLLFNKSLSSGKNLKLSLKGVLRYSSLKGSHPTSISNYRPISLLSVISKLLERHTHHLISCLIAIHYTIAPHQWGFQPRKSALSALIDIIH